MPLPHRFGKAFDLQGAGGTSGKQLERGNGRRLESLSELRLSNADMYHTVQESTNLPQSASTQCECEVFESP